MQAIAGYVFTDLPSGWRVLGWLGVCRLFWVCHFFRGLPAHQPPAQQLRLSLLACELYNNVIHEHRRSRSSF